MQELFSNRTRQHALSASLGLPTPPDVRDGKVVKETMEPPTRDGREGAIDALASSVNRNARYDGEVVFEDVSTDAIIGELAKRIIERHKR